MKNLRFFTLENVICFTLENFWALLLIMVSNFFDHYLLEWKIWSEEKIRFLRPKAEKDSWFNILVLHQNRSRRCHDRSTGAYLPESLIPTFFDLVIWGHEHECKIGIFLWSFSKMCLFERFLFASLLELCTFKRLLYECLRTY